MMLLHHDIMNVMLFQLPSMHVLQKMLLHDKRDVFQLDCKTR